MHCIFLVTSLYKLNQYGFTGAESERNERDKVSQFRWRDATFLKRQNVIHNQACKAKVWDSKNNKLAWTDLLNRCVSNLRLTLRGIFSSSFLSALSEISQSRRISSDVTALLQDSGDDLAVSRAQTQRFPLVLC